MSDHVCLAGDHCKGWHKAEDGCRIPAPTQDADSLCRGCLRGVEDAAGQLWSDYLALHRMIGEKASKQQTEARKPSPRSQVLINVNTDALMGFIVDATDRCASALCERMGANDPAQSQPLARLTANLAVIEPNVDMLIRVGPIDIQEWAFNGVYYGQDETTGVELALMLVELHRRAVAHIGAMRVRHKMPVPCPSTECGAHTLGRWDGAAVVDCLTCGIQYTEDQYRRLCLIGAEDYKGHKPKPRESHLARWYRFNPDYVPGPGRRK